MLLLGMGQELKNSWICCQGCPKGHEKKRLEDWWEAQAISNLGKDSEKKQTAQSFSRHMQTLYSLGI